MEEIINIPETSLLSRLESLMALWDRGELDEALQEYLVQHIPILQLLRPDKAS